MKGFITWMLTYAVISVDGNEVNTNLSTQVCCSFNGGKEQLDCLKPNEKSLDLSHKGLKSLPFCLKSTLTESIEKLDLDNNNITDYDKLQMLNTFPNLKSLLMWNNALSILRGNQLNVKHSKLCRLDLGLNLIHTIERGFFTSFGNLEELKLEKNLLTFLPSFVFHGLKKLKTLDLSFNKIQTFLMNWFDVGVPLASIDMANNSISSWQPFDFVWPHTMIKINFSDNLLPAILPFPPDTTNDHWSVDLRHNPLYCGCRLTAHKDYFKTTQVACRIRLDCPSFDIESQRSDRNLHFSSCAQGKQNKSWLSSFMERPLCAPPKAKGHKQIHPLNSNIACVSCVATGFPPPEMNIRYGIYKHHISSNVGYKFNPNTEVIVRTEHAHNVTCEAVNIFGCHLQTVAATKYYRKDSACRMEDRKQGLKKENVITNMLTYVAVATSISTSLAFAVCFISIKINQSN